MDSAYISDSDHDNMPDSESDKCPPPGATLAAEDIDPGEFNPYSRANDNTSLDKRNITALLDAYGSLSVLQLLDRLAANFTHRVLPESLGMPSRNKDAFAQHAAGIFSIFESFRMKPVEMLKMEGWKATWVLRANMEGVLKGGRGEWRNECVMIVKMDDGGELVEEIQEFVDSAKALEMKRQYAPKDFAGEEPRRTAVGHRSSSSFLTTFCWFLVCVLLAKMGAQVLPLLIFWGHPTLDAFRQSCFARRGGPTH
jgi:hypothetical protein